MKRALVGASVLKETESPPWGGAFGPETNRPAQACLQGPGWALAGSFSKVGRALLETLTELPQRLSQWAVDSAGRLPWP